MLKKKVKCKGPDWRDLLYLVELKQFGSQCNKIVCALRHLVCSVPNLIFLNRTGNYQIVFLCKYRITCKGNEEIHSPVTFHQCNMNSFLVFVEKSGVDKLKTVVGL